MRWEPLQADCVMQQGVDLKQAAKILMFFAAPSLPSKAAIPLLILSVLVSITFMTATRRS